MKNPISPYPGRQLFVGQTEDGKSCIAYLLTGRSPESRARKASLSDNKVIIGPLHSAEYDPLRHYTAVLFDNSTGVAAVSNGIQTDAIYETYRLFSNVGAPPFKEYLAMIMEGAGAEPDSYHTPRIGSVITEGQDIGIVCLIGIKRHDRPASVFQVKPEPGILTGISVYGGSLESPAPYDQNLGLQRIDIKATSADAIARNLFEISAATYNGEDIRVGAVGGIRSGKSWDIALLNAR